MLTENQSLLRSKPITGRGKVKYLEDAEKEAHGFLNWALCSVAIRKTLR